MDIEKLIERLRTDSLYADKATLEIMDLCMEAADALSTLQAENEKLWTELKSNVDLVFRQAKELDRRHLLLQEQEAEMEQVKRERDAAVSDLTLITYARYTRMTRWRRTFHPRRTLQLSNPMRTRTFLLWFINCSPAEAGSEGCCWL